MAAAINIAGLFIDYNASFEHLDAIGNKRIAIITNVEIHELIHVVHDMRPGADSMPDFLVNDIPDPNDRPDTIHLSNGSVEPVNVVESGSFSGALSGANLQLTLTASMPSGWTYLRVPDPGNGQYVLTRVVRSDGTEILMSTNVWTTDRTFIGNGQRPIRENILHLFDYGSTGSYTLYYAPAAAADVIAPTSAVATLVSSVTSPLIQVTWSGQDNAGGDGIAFYDIYVSKDGGPFAIWLQNTALNSALFSGAPGSTYAFYSVATDAAGNRESSHALADTPVTIVPVITPGADTLGVAQGATVSVPIVKLLANDKDNGGFALTLTAVSPSSSQNGGVSINGNFVVYTASGGFSGQDSFTYTVIDGHGGSAQGTVAVTVTPASHVAPNIVSLNLDQGNNLVKLDFVGIPGRHYVVQMAETVGAPWQDISPTITANSTGLIHYETGIANSSGFFRIRVSN